MIELNCGTPNFSPIQIGSLYVPLMIEGECPTPLTFTCHSPSGLLYYTTEVNQRLRLPSALIEKLLMWPLVRNIIKQSHPEDLIAYICTESSRGKTRKLRYHIILNDLNFNLGWKEGYIKARYHQIIIEKFADLLAKFTELFPKIHQISADSFKNRPIFTKSLPVF